jgi:hypothetical protein
MARQSGKGVDDQPARAGVESLWFQVNFAEMRDLGLGRCRAWPGRGGQR